MSISTKRTPLSECITLQRGFDLPERVRQPGTVPVVASTGVVGEHNEPKVSPPGVVIGRSGSIGGGQYVETDFWPLNTTLWVRDFKGHDPRYIYYLLKSIDFSRFNAGAGVPTLNRNHLSSILVPQFGSDRESRLGSILSKYDKLIENSRRRIQLLEQGIRLLYREWFVWLRFPGHEHVGIKDGVPSGWKSYQLDELCCIGRGASPRPINRFMDGNVPWFKIGDASSSESAYVFETGEHVSEDGARKSVKLEPRSLMLSNSATCGVPYFTGVSGCIHDGWLYFRQLTRVFDLFLYCYFLSKKQELLNSVGDGSTQNNLNTAAVGRLQVALPEDDTLLRKFDAYVAPMFSAAFVLARQNNKLRETRNLLLPRLMNGAIKI